MSFLTVVRRGPQNFFFTFAVQIPERFAPRSQLRAFGPPLLPDSAFGLASLGINLLIKNNLYVSRKFMQCVFKDAVALLDVCWSDFLKQKISESLIM